MGTSRRAHRDLRLVTALAVASTCFVAGPARAWGPDGHVVIARVAEAHLSARARRALVPLLEGRRLADIASWADDWRGPHPETAPWHFRAIPLDPAGYDAPPHCSHRLRIAAAI